METGINMEITKELLEMVAESARRTVNIEELGKETLLIEDLGYNSVDIMELVIQIEEKYGIDFSDSDIFWGNMNCISAISEYVEKKLQERKNG